MGILRASVRWLLRAVLGAERALAATSAAADLLGAASYRFSSSGRRSAVALASMRGTYSGRRCFVIGNGPSLAAMDLSPLSTEITFGLNRGYLLFPRIGGPTTFLVSINGLVIEQSGAEMADASSTKLFSWAHRRHLREREGEVIWVRTVRKAGFSTDPVRDGVWEGATVTYVALQLAYYLGFQTVVLIGVDHSFSTQGPAHEVVTSRAGDANHFDPNYFGPGYRWQLPDLETSEVAYRMARRAFEADGRAVIDATVNGKLQVFQKGDYASLFDPR